MRRDGGQAFPVPGYYPPGIEDASGDRFRELLELRTVPEEGMSLRDYFAGQAMIGFTSTIRAIDVMTTSPDELAKNTGVLAYLFANAMLEARDLIQPPKQKPAPPDDE